MKKYVKWLAMSVAVIAFILVIYLIFNTSEDSYLNERGIAVTWLQYIKAIDPWNVIFFIIFVGITFVVFLLTYYGMDQLLKAIVRRKPKLAFLNSDTADIVVQLPLTFIAVFVWFIIATNLYVAIGARGSKMESANDIPHKKVVVILGTSKYLSSGKGINKYYEYRINAGVELFKTDSVKYIIVSGDGLGEAHKPGTYNETREMKADLIAAGVPEEKIKIDSLGLRTTDSALRLIAVFKTIDVIYVSQGFHTTRAVVQSEFYGIKAKAYDAKGTANTKMMIKEILLSRPALVFDMMLANVQPRIEGGGAVEYRQKFEVTSNRHVGLILTLAILIWILFRGVNKWIDANKEERNRVMKKYFGWTAVFLFITIGLVSQVYARTEWKFAEEFVHSVLKPLNIKTAKMEKEEVKIEAKIAEIKREEEEFIIPTTIRVKEHNENERPLIEEAKITQAAAEFNTAVSDQPANAVVPTASEKVSEPKAEEVKKQEDLFNTAEGESDNETDAFGDKVEKPKEKRFFKVRVHSAQTVQHDGTILLRLDEPTSIGSKSYAKNFVFEGKTVLFNGRFIIVSSALDGGSGTEVKNYENGKEGSVVQSRHLGKKKDEIVLAEGELLTFSAF